MLPTNAFGELLIKETVEDFQTAASGDLGHILGGLHPEHADAPVLEGFEQDPVVATDLHHEGVADPPQFPSKVRRVPFEVGAQCGGDRRQVSVVAEDDLGRDHIQHLDEGAIVAKGNPERIGPFVAHLGFEQEVPGQGHPSEVEKRPHPSAAACATGFAAVVVGVWVRKSPHGRQLPDSDGSISRFGGLAQGLEFTPSKMVSRPNWKTHHIHLVSAMRPVSRRAESHTSRSPMKRAGHTSPETSTPKPS